MSCGIYKITNMINNKSYIGQSVDIVRRWNKHKNFSQDRSEYPLYRAFKKYGVENFNFSILEECSPDKLNEKEIYYIKYYNSYNDGYNQTMGGQGSLNAKVKLSNEEIFIIYDLLLNSKIPQREIAHIFNVGEDTISEINTGKTRVQEGYSYPLRQNKHSKNYCPDCGKEILSTSQYCNICIHIHSRTIERPDRKTLKKLIKTKSFVQIGKDYNITDNAIRRWCDYYKLPRTKKEINSYSDEEWKNI